MVPTPNSSSTDHIDPAVEFLTVEKYYGGLRALGGVNLTVRAGTVHAIIGQNGAGKSSLVGVLTGRVMPSAGRVRLYGKEDLPYGDPVGCGQRGIACVYQELTLIESEPVMYNVLLGHLRSTGGFLRKGVMRETYAEMGSRYGIHVAGERRCRELHGGEKQLVEILKALSRDPRILILDEPTSTIDQGERRQLFRTVRGLKERGVTIILVDHNLEEVINHADLVTVMRDGVVVATRPSGRWTVAELADAVTGQVADRETGEHKTPHGQAGRGQVARTKERSSGSGLVLDHIEAPPALRDVGLRIGGGEIVGLVGGATSGRKELCRMLGGMEASPQGGHLLVDGVPTRWPRTPRQSERLGIAYLPEERKRSGLVLGMSGADNLLLGAWARGEVTRWGIRRPGREVAMVSEWREIVALGARSNLRDPVGQLSGGNQQKILLARTISGEGKFLILDEPTRGVDVGASRDIVTVVRELARGGAGVLWSSSELQQVLNVADRILVMRDGVVVKEVTPLNATASDLEEAISGGAVRVA